MTRHRVLIVDDETAFTRLLTLNLTRTDRYEVHVENNPHAALAAALAFKPDLVLLDVVMPGMDGGQVLSELRRVPGWEALPVIFLTATITERGVDEHKGTIRGVPFVAKPVEPKKLMKRIEAELARNGASQP